MSNTPSTPATRTVFCAKLQQQLPGLDEPPFDTELGRRIYEQISRDAWMQWMDYCRLLLNEYRLNPAHPDHQEFLVKQMEQFFFGEAPAPPPDYVEPKNQ